MKGIKLSKKGHRFYIIWNGAITSSFTKTVRVFTRSKIGNIIRKKLRRKTYETGISYKSTMYVEIFKNVKSIIAATEILKKRNQKKIHKAIYFKGAEPEYLKLHYTNG